MAYFRNIIGRLTAVCGFALLLSAGMCATDGDNQPASRDTTDINDEEKFLEGSDFEQPGGKPAAAEQEGKAGTAEPGEGADLKGNDDSPVTDPAGDVPAGPSDDLSP